MKSKKECSSCAYWSKHQCLDSEGKSILKYDTSNNKYVELAEPYWMYEDCKKNWGLPQVAYTSAENCKYFKATN